MEARAVQLNKTKIERCCFDSIDLQVKRETKMQTITIFDSKDKANVLLPKFFMWLKNIYVLTHDKGETIPVRVVRKNSDKCSLNPDKHSGFSFNGKKNSANEIKVLYPQIPEKVSDFSFLKYFFLPISERIGEKHLLKFDSCQEDPMCTIVGYPNIEYTIALGSDIAERTIYLKFSSSYNNGFTREFELTREQDADINADLKKKTTALRKAKLAFEFFMKSEAMAQKMSKIKAPIKPKLITPDLFLDLTWGYVVSENCSMIGRKICIAFKAEPLIGISVTIDLLQIGLNALTPGLGTLVSFVKDVMKECGNGVQVVCELVIQGTISVSRSELEINTSEKKPVSFNFKKNKSTIGIKLNAAVSGEVSAWFFEASTIVSAKSEGSFSLEGKFSYEKDILGLDLSVNFDGLKVSVVWKVEAALKKKKTGYSREKEWTLIEEEDNIFEWDTIELINFNK